jgi:hypothetical protein
MTNVWLAAEQNFEFIIAVKYENMLGGSPWHHSMARPRVADGRDSLQLEVSCEYIE